MGRGRKAVGAKSNGAHNVEKGVGKRQRRNYAGNAISKVWKVKQIDILFFKHW